MAETDQANSKESGLTIEEKLKIVDAGLENEFLTVTTPPDQNSISIFQIIEAFEEALPQIPLLSPEEIGRVEGVELIIPNEGDPKIRFVLSD